LRLIHFSFPSLSFFFDIVDIDKFTSVMNENVSYVKYYSFIFLLSLCTHLILTQTAGLSHVEDGIGAGTSISTSTLTSTGPPPNPYGFTSLFQPSSKLDSSLASPLLASPHNGNDNNDDDGDNNNNNDSSTRNRVRNSNSSAEQKNRPKGWSFFRRYGSTDDMDTPP
jgi:hypothetical protein